MMTSFTLQLLAKRYGGNVVGPEKAINSVSTDTRQVKAGELFVALKGENFDAHDHLEEAIKKGVVCFVINKNNSVKLTQNSKHTVWMVEDTTKALAWIATYQREQFVHPLVGITGSSGKTSVKGMLLKILSAAVGSDHVFATQGNLNNHIGVPFSIFEINPKHQFAVIEMGASGLNEIAYLCDIAKPTVSVINNVMPAHIEGFGSIEGIAKTKGEIYQGLSEEGVAIINGDDDFSDMWLSTIKNNKTLIFSPSGKAERASIFPSKASLLSNGCYEFVLHYGRDSSLVKLNVLGQHNIANACAAAACAYALGIDIQSAVDGLQDFSAEKGRLNIRKGLNDSSVIDDTYNANPGSMRAAIDVLAEASSESVFIMGDMGELGDGAELEHRKIGIYAKEKNIKTFFSAGVNSRQATEGFGDGAQHFDTVESLISSLYKFDFTGSVILVKGSRSSRMEKVVHALDITGDDNASLAC